MIIPEIVDVMKEALQICAERFGVAPEKILGQSRSADIVMPRHVLMYVFCDQIVNNSLGSLKDIGRFFGKRDHSTVVHARETVWDAIEQPYVAKELLMASMAAELCAWMKPRVAEALKAVGRERPALTRTIAFFERVEKLERELAELRAIVMANGHANVLETINK